MHAICIFPHVTASVTLSYASSRGRGEVANYINTTQNDVMDFHACHGICHAVLYANHTLQVGGRGNLTAHKMPLDQTFNV